jgi:hypothetical protein
MAMERKIARPKKSRSKRGQSKGRGERNLIPVTAEEFLVAET